MRGKIPMSLLLLLCSAIPAGAHAFLDRAEPRVGSTVASAPREVSMWFTQQLEPAFSNAEVVSSAGAPVSQGRARIDGTVMHVPVRALPPGTYRVRWKVLSVDTHTTEGSFTFRVGQ